MSRIFREQGVLVELQDVALTVGEVINLTEEAIGRISGEAGINLQDLRKPHEIKEISITNAGKAWIYSGEKNYEGSRLYFAIEDIDHPNLGWDPVRNI